MMPDPFDNLKTRCVASGCDTPLEMTLERYEQDGNWCKKCNTKAANKVKTPSEAERTRVHRSTNKGIYF